MAQQQINPGSAPIIWSDVASAFETINDNFTELYASVGGDGVNFTSLGTSLVPRTTELYDLGSSTKRWRDVWLSGASIHLGDAIITSTGTTVNLPVGSTIGGLRVDENYFKFIAVAGQDNIEADDGTDTLTIAAGNLGITLTTDAATDTLTITNSGVTSLTGTPGQIGVSQSTGGVTLTNLGVTSATAGQGIGLNADVGPITITNTGVVGLAAGIGIQLSPRDPITGVVQITNSQPNIPQQTFSIVAVPTQTPIAADSTSDTLTIQTSGAGLSITTAPLTDTLTFTNTGVTSLAVGDGLTIDAGTGAINLTLDATLNRSIVGDVTGSVFADDSTELVDAVEAKIVGDVETARLRTSETTIALGGGAGEITQGVRAVAIGDEAGRTNQGVRAVAIGYYAGQSNQSATALAIGDEAGRTNQGVRAVAIGYLAGGADQGAYAVAIGDEAGRTNQGSNAIAIGNLAGQTNQIANSIVINASGSSLNGAAAGLYVDPIRNQPGTGNILQYDTTTKEIIYSSSIDGDLTGSVFADDSTLLVDGVAGKIVGNIETTFATITNGLTVQDIYAQNASGVNISTGGFNNLVVFQTSVELQNVPVNVADDLNVSGTINGNLNGRLNGDVTGSVFADDSTLLIDGTEGTINATALVGALPAIDGSALTGVVADSVDWTDVTNTPTTLSGYGITDAATSSQGSLADSAIQPADLGSFTFAGSILDTSDSSSIAVTPAVTFNSDVTIENELFVNNSVTITGSLVVSGTLSTTFSWSDVIGTPTTLSGYGIIDAATSSQGSLADSAIQPADLGTFTFAGSTLDTSDSSGISVTPSVTFNSDVTIENELFVDNDASITGSVNVSGTLTARITTRSVTAPATSGTLVPNGDTTDVYIAEGLTDSITIDTPSGTPFEGQRLVIRLRDDGTGRSITWTSTSGAFRAIGVTLPTTTVAGKITYVGCIYNSIDSFWDVIAAVTEA